MAPQVSTIEPSVLTAGDTWLWEVSDVTDYPISEGWTLSYEIGGVDKPQWNAGWATNNGSTWSIAIPADQTRALTAGRYQWAAIMTGSGSYAGRRHVIRTGVFELLPDPATAQPGELQSQDEKDLAVIVAVMAGRITADIQQYAIGGRSVIKMTVGELWRWRTILETRVWRAKHPGQVGPAIASRFVSAG